MSVLDAYADGRNNFAKVTPLDVEIDLFENARRPHMATGAGAVGEAPMALLLGLAWSRATCRALRVAIKEEL